MAELWDIYDINKKKIGRTAERMLTNFQEQYFESEIIR